MSVIEGRSFAGTLDAAVEAEIWGAAEAERLGLSSDEAFAMTLCLEELFVNAVRHGRAREVRLAMTREGWNSVTTASRSIPLARRRNALKARGSTSKSGASVSGCCRNSLIGSPGVARGNGTS